MKKIANLLMILSVALFAACDDPVDTTVPPLKVTPYNLDGTWQLAEWNGVPLADSTYVYLVLDRKQTFEMYQKIGSGAYRLYRGTWNLENGLLTGKYNDGEGWAAAYNVEIKDRNLTLTSNNDAAESTLYTRCEIPAEVKDGCEVVVKSCEGGL